MALSGEAAYLRTFAEKMAHPSFRPGFRLSLLDILILFVGLTGSVFLGSRILSAGLIVGFVVLHFFLFCNVFRISRPPELIWASVFVALAAITIFTGLPGWVVTFTTAIILSTFLIWRETKREDYHGIYWERWNPSLPDWWESRQANPIGEQDGSGQPATRSESKFSHD